MRQIISITFAFIIAIAFGIILGIVFEHFRPKYKPNPDSLMVRQLIDLYNFKVKIPDNIFIGIPLKDSNEVILFNYSDAVKGLEYLGTYKKEP